MLEKLIIIYSLIITINSTNKFSTWAALDGKYMKGKETAGGSATVAGDMETWQPIMQTHNWLATPSYSTSTPSVLTTSKPSGVQTSSLRIKLADKLYVQQRKYLNQHQQTNNYVAYNHRSGNYSKFNLKSPPPLGTTSSSMSSTSPTKNTKLKPYILYKQQQNTPYHHQRHYPLKHIEILYPAPTDVNTKIPSSPSHNFDNHVADINQDEHQQPQMQYSNRIIHPQTTIDTSNVHIDPTDTILSSNALNSFTTNENLIDSKITNSMALNSRKAEYVHDDDDDGDDANNVLNLNEKLFLLPTIFDDVIEIYDNVKDIILSDKDIADDIYSNEDKIDDDDDNDNDLTKLNSASDGDVRAASTLAAIATEKIPSLKIKKTITWPSLASSMGEVQGHKKQNDKGTTMKYSLASSSTAAAATTHLSKTHNTPTEKWPLAADLTARSFTWNMSKVNGGVPPQQSSSVVGTGRKIKKKFKKKFKKFLLPLVLAYKLKFLALIPLLLGGLTLLVGTTGLAGFFFALFAAVMSLKAGGGGKSAIVVKKY